MQRVFGITGWKNAGKTTLVEGLVRELVRRGLKVATVKHAHHDFDIDQPSRRWALIHELRDEVEPELSALLAKLSPCDLVLVEGFKRDAHPKLEVIGPHSPDTPRYREDPSIVALAGVMKPETTLPFYDRDDVAGIAGFILTYMGLT
jgi:molybdopterin-guanine dinucleotide biosynthesis protein B